VFDLKIAISAMDKLLGAKPIVEDTGEETP
jgi:hypothetical protein